MASPISDTAAISIESVNRHFGKSGLSLRQLCTMADINRWSLRRPIRHTGLGLSLDDFKAANWGYTINSYSTPALLYAALQAGTAWSENKPAGSSASPYRLGDFRGYDPSSKQWIGQPGDIEFDSASDNDSHTFFSDYTITPATQTVFWWQAAAYSGRYACVAWRIGQTWRFKTASRPYNALTSGTSSGANPTVTLTREEMGVDTANPEAVYMLCICDRAYTDVNATQLANAHFYPIPTDSPLVANISYSYMTPLQCNFVGVLGGDDAKAITTGTKFKYAENYGNIASSTGGNMILGLGNSGELALLVNLINKGNTARSTTYLSLLANRTLCGGTDINRRPTVYKTSGEQGGVIVNSLTEVGYAEAISVPANGYTVLVLYDAYLQRIDSSGSSQASLPSGASTTSTLQLQWTDVDAGKANVSGSLMLRVKQGSDYVGATIASVSDES